MQTLREYRSEFASGQSVEMTPIRRCILGSPSNTGEIVIVRGFFIWFRRLLLRSSVDRMRLLWSWTAVTAKVDFWHPMILRPTLGTDLSWLTSDFAEIRSSST